MLGLLDLAFPRAGFDFVLRINQDFCVVPLKPLPVRAKLERYLRQAAKLITAFEAGDPMTVQDIRRFHPRLPGRANTNDRNPITPKDIREAGFSARDAEAVVARWHG